MLAYLFNNTINVDFVSYLIILQLITQQIVHMKNTLNTALIFVLKVYFLYTALKYISKQ